MPSQSLCTTCRRVLQQQSCNSRRLQIIHERISLPSANTRSQPFSTIRSKSLAPAAAVPPPPPQAYQAKPPPGFESTSVPQSKPGKGQPNITAQGIAKSLRESLPAATETYVAYGVCEKLVKDCSRQADYRIPQASEKNTEIPKTKDGEDLGVGEGWWYESTSSIPSPVALYAGNSTTHFLASSSHMVC